MTEKFKNGDDSGIHQVNHREITGANKDTSRKPSDPTLIRLADDMTSRAHEIEMGQVMPLTPPPPRA